MDVPLLAPLEDLIEPIHAVLVIFAQARSERLERRVEEADEIAAAPLEIIQVRLGDRAPIALEAVVVPEAHAVEGRAVAVHQVALVGRDPDEAVMGGIGHCEAARLTLRGPFLVLGLHDVLPCPLVAEATIQGLIWEEL
jgi:hypothetical protein